MTYLDKLKQDHPNRVYIDKMGEERGLKCPYNHSYETTFNPECDRVTCGECWNREMPEESESLKAVELGEAARKGFEDGMKVAKTYSHEEIMKALDLCDEDLADNPDENELIEKALSDEKPGAWVGKIFKRPCNYYTDGTEKIRGIRHNGDDIDETPVLTDDINEVFNTPCNSIKDSGDRTQFATGAVRDMHEGKGRCDLLPLDVIDTFYNHVHGCKNDISSVFYWINRFMSNGDKVYLYNVIRYFKGFVDIETMFLEVAKHFEDGAKKYGEYNWQKGIPVNCYIDSAVRHYLKYLRGDEDERHDRAFVWNILCCIWTCKHKPELNTYLKKDE